MQSGHNIQKKITCENRLYVCQNIRLILLHIFMKQNIYTKCDWVTNKY